MNRQQIVAGNWKMNKTLAEGSELVKEVLSKLKNPNGLVIFGAPYVHLATVAGLIEGKENVSLAAQNVHHEEKGAFTGEISADMLLSVGVKYVIVGHSERRQYFKEGNELLARKVETCLKKGLVPIFCCGEPLHIREKGTHVGYVGRQLRDSIFHLPETEFKKVVIAYEPIWAIGTGKTATTEQAQEMHAAIRGMISKSYGQVMASRTPILYGGSCNAQNANALLSQPDVDGGLIGGASLKADDFLAIVNAMKPN